MSDKVLELRNLKKYGGYGLVLLIGLLLGYFLFNSGTEEDHLDHTKEITAIATYTCSMHPQVSKNEEGKCPLCGMDLVAVNATSNDIILGVDQFSMSENALALANVETSIVGLNDKNKGNSIVLSGKITSNDKTNAVQTTLFDGRIDKLDINYIGEYVKKGDQIGLIYSPEMYLAQDKLLTSASYKDTHQKLYAAARNTLGLWKMTDAQIDEILRTGKPMMNFPLYADVSGTVTSIMAAEGNYYKQGDPLYKVSNLYTVWAVFDAYENQLPLLKVGQDMVINSNAFKGEVIKAKISFIEPVMDENKRTVAVRVTLNNRDKKFKPGMFIQGSVAVNYERQLLTVPKSAVLWTGTRSVVYVKSNPNELVFEMAQVTLGERIGDSYFILDGLDPGAEVVTNGAFTVDAAAQLQGKKSMMNTGGQRKLPSANLEDIGVSLQIKENRHILKLTQTYFDLKNQLVKSDFKKSQGEALKLQAILDEIDINSFEGALKPNLEKFKKYTKGTANAGQIEEQRLQFKNLSEEMIVLLDALGGLNETIYVQHCPMADNNSGANWLSFESEIRNPYFGDQMLTCGSITRKIQ
ncbi:efflux RND transporter periplasmic adaptor subunit [Maribacter sp. R77961]|uniref:efflux RND transporter periplasmic adaptor subunit n=1 Tax=Maribacter sp. R77961 TaxID=3093871 RepID=UPI0037CBEF9F